MIKKTALSILLCGNGLAIATDAATRTDTPIKQIPLSIQVLD